MKLISKGSLAVDSETARAGWYPRHMKQPMLNVAVVGQEGKVGRHTGSRGC
jgi:hypothetical protein